MSNTAGTWEIKGVVFIKRSREIENKVGNCKQIKGVVRH